MKDKTRHSGLHSGSRRSARTRAILLACQTGLVTLLQSLADLRKRRFAATEAEGQ